MFKFEKMIAWQKSVEYVDRAFNVADHFAQRNQFSLGEQLRRAGLSITNNLAEGSGRVSPGHRRNFYDSAKGSAYEVVSILAIALRRKECSQTDYDYFYARGDELAAIISGLIDSTYREEEHSTKSPRVLREDDSNYAAADDQHSNSNSPL